MTIITFIMATAPIFSETVRIYCEKNNPPVLFGAQELRAALKVKGFDTRLLGLEVYPESKGKIHIALPPVNLLAYFSVSSVVILLLLRSTLNIFPARPPPILLLFICIPPPLKRHKDSISRTAAALRLHKNHRLHRETI